MTTTAITIEFDPDRLTTYTDSHLAMLWSLAQANPDNGFDTSQPGELAERIGREVIRRWLRNVEPEMYHHQGRHYYWRQLTKLATYQPPADAPTGSPEWHSGQWVARPTPPAAVSTANPTPAPMSIPEPVAEPLPVAA
ncbi:hypothetical protein DMB66_27730 [Actinoplanes sp. ATCC 53533]|uniref:hypothetical protein n=1 Tax=Actinoplanes sp. ATCC 53533 TaxID=1288362 RepID=UPI000F7A9FC6|nr:hypothetical protein [Actinoplanes sp. ATCC 53533]RSM59478.1 hypothetical protein DMB66_27730 [Actinoplanes sp. ATCC 53533]